MTRYEVEQHLNALYRDLEVAEGMDEETAQRAYNVDCKSEILEVIQDEIDTCRVLLQPDPEDNGMDYDALCMVQGLSRYA